MTRAEPRSPSLMHWAQAAGAQHLRSDPHWVLQAGIRTVDARGAGKTGASSAIAYVPDMGGLNVEDALTAPFLRFEFGGLVSIGRGDDSRT